MSRRHSCATEYSKPPSFTIDWVAAGEVMVVCSTIHVAMVFESMEVLLQEFLIPCLNEEALENPRLFYHIWVHMVETSIPHP